MTNPRESLFKIYDGNMTHVSRFTFIALILIILCIIGPIRLSFFKLSLVKVIIITLLSISIYYITEAIGKLNNLKLDKSLLQSYILGNYIYSCVSLLLILYIIYTF